MSDELSAQVMHRQLGLITREQALATGMPAPVLEKKVRGGEWVVVRRGVYLPRARWAQLDEHRGRPVARAVAAGLRMQREHVMSHDSAALLLGIPLIQAPRLVHVTRRGHLGGRVRHGMKHHQAPFLSSQVATSIPVPCLDLARTAADLAREHGERAGVVAFDAALRLGATQSELDDAVAAMAYWPYVTVVRHCLALADGRSESPGESLMRLLLVGLRLGPVEPQFGLRRHGRTVWCDLRVGRHIFEFDGRQKYRSSDRGGFAVDAERALWAEKEREDFVRSFRLGMTRLYWSDLQPDRWAATERRAIEAVQSSDRLYGRDLSDLTDARITRAA